MESIEIVLDDICQILGERKVLNGVNLRLQPGATTVILGPSGSGKSTLLKTAAAIVPPTSGRLTIGGIELHHLGERGEQEFRRRSSFVFQDAALWANRSVEENIRFPLEVHFPEMEPQRAKERIARYVKMVGYGDRMDYRPSQISSGEQKLVSLARALITEPEILFLDNPLTGLDSNAAEAMTEVIRNLHQAGKTIVGCFSDPLLVSAVADELVILDEGCVTAQGPFREVRDSRDPAVRRIIATILEESNAYREDILTLLGESQNPLAEEE
jgi:ABC-type multidrug transport system ATPase subunit